MRSPQRRRQLSVVALVLPVMVGSARGAVVPPWPRTEVRQPCATYDPLRSPYFGDLHVHTRFSADAYIFGTRVDPRGAYDFAQGGKVTLADENEAQTRSARLDRRLDFAAVTDHSEWFGQVRLCVTPESAVYDDDLCQILRRPEPDLDLQTITTVRWLLPAGVSPPPKLAICLVPGVDCDAQAVSVWQDIQAAAEEAYDRTAACAFTSFVGYEHTPSPIGKHLHRNIIFRNEHVPSTAASFLDTWQGGTPQGIWSAVETACLNAGTGCDAVIIPHNSNLSGGQQWLDPADATEAQRRQTLEPLVEIHQIKSNSECRFDRLAGAGAGTADELCTFEQNPNASQDPREQPPAIDAYPRRNMIRNTLKDGLAFERTLGVNPFRLGFVGSTDNHDGTPGNVDEAGWPGGQGNNDGSPANRISEGMRTNPGGLTVVWAEENSRDALFEALRRRETYATSGTRPVVRFFGGELDGVECGTRAFVRRAYAGGAPMGGELGPVRGDQSPRFAVWAVKDPGTSAHPGTDLQRIQIIKGWVDAKGKTHERVFNVAGRTRSRASVDTSCAPTGHGARELCAVWRDPAFRPSQRAFYYARVLENPSCRWSTLVCKAAGVDPLSPACATQAATAGAAYADCCLGPLTDPFMEPVVQERAWTSPIWYRPDGISRLEARLRFGKQAQSGTLSLRVWLGGLPDSATNDLAVHVTDAAEVFGVTIPAGTLRRRGHLFVLPAGAGLPGGIRKASLVRGNGTGLLRIEARGLDLTQTDRGDHMITVSVGSGTYRVAHSRLWVSRHDTLEPQ